MCRFAKPRTGGGQPVRAFHRSTPPPAWMHGPRDPWRAGDDPSSIRGARMKERRKPGDAHSWWKHREMQARKRARTADSTSAADSEVVDAQCGLPHAYGDALAFLAARADTIVELQIVTDHAHAGENVWAVADEGGPF